MTTFGKTLYFIYLLACSIGGAVALLVAVHP